MVLIFVTEVLIAYLFFLLSVVLSAVNDGSFNVLVFIPYLVLSARLVVNLLQLT